MLDAVLFCPLDGKRGRIIGYQNGYFCMETPVFNSVDNRLKI